MPVEDYDGTREQYEPPSVPDMGVQYRLKQMCQKENAALRQRIAELEAESEGRRKALLRVGDERRTERLRADNAEAERDTLKASVERWMRQYGEATERAAELEHAMKLEQIEHDRLEGLSEAQDKALGASQKSRDSAYRRGMERAAEIADLHKRETLAEAVHKEWSSCKHPECCEQRSMSKTAREIARDIRAEAAKECHA